MAGGAFLKQVGIMALDALLPPHCLACGGWVDRAAQLCADCWPRLHFIHDPVCACCGLPFDADLGPDALCGACLQSAPQFDRARAVLRYDEHSSPLVLALKHGDRLDGVRSFAHWMARGGGQLVTSCDLIAPVPLHRWRLWRRRYNQAALLANALGRLAGRPVCPDLLVRIRPTPSQGGLTRAQRADNVRGAFALAKPKVLEKSALSVPAAFDKSVNGKHILLVDDVMTTGATANACARVLKQAGAAGVDVLVLARAVHSN